MATNTVGIDKEVEVDRKENLRDHRLYWIGRRTQDVILSSLALVVLSPVMLATAIAIVVDDPSAGPVFSQERIGRNGKPFKFYKFRQSIFAEQWSGKFGPTYSESRRSLEVKTFDNYTVITVNGKKTEVHPQTQPKQQGSMGDPL